MRGLHKTARRCSMSLFNTIFLIVSCLEVLSWPKLADRLLARNSETERVCASPATYADAHSETRPTTDLDSVLVATFLHHLVRVVVSESKFGWACTDPTSDSY